ncbi:hypothetical protein O3M35_013155 [Rhynocoris fuscipes]|uniref:Cytochrome P450 n=1 Tax=Rhynocoris fuscipes TaxID=488301 RepID=A0AAW1CF11_9HEMI
MDPIVTTLIAIILTGLAYFIYQAYEANKFWKKAGIPHKKPLLFLGNWPLEMLYFKKGFLESIRDYLKDFPDDEIVGFYDFTKPRLMIKNIDAIDKILVKDFMHFVDRGFPIDKRNSFDISLFSMTGKEWRAVRYKLSPLFTTTKLKSMYGPMAECSQSLTSILDKADESQDIDVKEYIGCFAMDVIGSSAYGIDAKNLAQPDNEFRRMGKKSFQFDFLNMLKFLVLNLMPILAKLLKLSFNKRDVADYFCKIIRDTIDYRKKNGIVRNDFLQMFMTLKEQKTIEFHTKDPDDDYLRMESEQSVENIEFTDDMMIGNAFAFFQAGFEATASAILMTLYELSKHTEIQDKVRKEIKYYVEEADGSLTYDALKKMTYLEQCVKETLRMYSPAPVLQRVCTKEYTLPNGFKITVGITIFIPIVTVHKDPQIYPEPEEFRPERFDPDQKLPPCAFIPFGNGPRICIAMRFALMEVKHCLAKLLMNHEYKLSPSTKPFRLNTRSVFTTPADPFLFNITKLKSN